MSEEYLPGYGPRTSRMLTARTVEERAPLTSARVRAGARVLDVGCGPATITVGLADLVGPSGRVTAIDTSPAQLQVARRIAAGHANLTFAAGSVYALPVLDTGVDGAFAHAVLEHLADPRTALEELGRVVRPDGFVALVSSDWSGAVVDPPDPDVTLAIRGYRELRHLTGADPYMGAHLDDLVAVAGFRTVERRGRHHRDMASTDLARYIHERLGETPVPVTASTATRRLLADARHAALRWVRQPDPSTVVQHWVEVIATRRGVSTPSKWCRTRWN